MRAILKRNLRQKQEGQSMFEMLVVFPFLLLIVFGIIQWGFIAKTKVTLNAATELSARAGALNHGSMSDIRRALAQGMVPLFMQGDASRNGLLRSYGRSRIAVQLKADIDILNPSSDVFNRLSKNVVYPLQRRRYREIPNDNLMYRPTNEISIGDNVTMNIQDANLLKIRVNWCERMIVPVVGRMFVNWASGIFDGAFFLPSAEQIRCNAIGAATGEPLLAMQSFATYRMQTTFRR